jgi:endonuclease/exonuclease/phosphatase family metal-dependent hydrolase
MDVSVDTFNLNNLFSRFNFEAQVDAIVEDDPKAADRHHLQRPERFRLRTYQGRLVHGKNPADQDTIAARITAMDLDVLCAQEVEDIDTLRFFAAQHLGGSYRYLVLVEGNDPRLIDLAVLSRLPLGAVASHQHAVHREQPAEAVFSRDLLEVDILPPGERLAAAAVFSLTISKSQFVPSTRTRVAGKGGQRHPPRRQAGMVSGRDAHTRDSRLSRRPDDTPDAPPLAAITASEQLGLVNGLTQPAETRPPSPTSAPPARGPGPTLPGGRPPARYELFDQIWLSPALAARQTGAFIDRRTRHGGDGSDHDPAWVTLTL